MIRLVMLILKLLDELKLQCLTDFKSPNIILYGILYCCCGSKIKQYYNHNHMTAINSMNSRINYYCDYYAVTWHRY